MDMDNDFLQKVNLEELKNELHTDLEGVAKIADVSTQTVYKWNRDKNKGGCRPTFDAVVNLLRSGASVESLFGVEYKAATKCVEVPVKLSDQEIIDGLQRALAALSKKSQ